MAPLVLPLVATVVAVTAMSGGRPFYSQARVGRGGRRFRCWKIRTMIPDADRVLADLIAEDPELADEWAEKQKLANDPRVTWFGRMLRKTSLDELPQLWNVLRGEMSLVGPRPFTPDQADLYHAGADDVAYYSLRPGITGLWQVSRRNCGSFAERAVYDHDYAGRLSLGFDLLILAQTVTVVLRGTGA